jgi:hypothetical protein
MSATQIGITGNWGIPNEQPGMILYDHSMDYSQQEKPCLTISGEISGFVFYQPKMEIKFSGYVPKTAGFSGKIGTPLVVANANLTHLSQSTGGTTITTQISRSYNNEDFEKIDVTAVHYPYVASGL